MATDQPSGRDDPDQHPQDRNAEQGHHHSPDHKHQPGQARAPAETRSRTEYAADVRGAGWSDQPASAARQPRDETPAQRTCSTGPANSREKGTETGSPAQHDARQEAGRQHRGDGTATESAASRGDYADSVRAQDPWQIDAGESASEPERQDRPADQPGTARMEDAGPRTDPSVADQTDDERGTGRYLDEDADTPDDHPSGQDRPSSEQPAESADWPSQADRDRWHAMYQDYLKDATTGRDQSVAVVGDKPDRSAGVTSGLPPTGEQLLHMEKDGASRPEKLRSKFLEEIGDATDSAKSVAQTTQDVLERPAPVGLPEIRVPAGPYVAPEVPLHTTISAGSVAELAVVLGVIVMQAGNRIAHRLAEGRRDDDGGYR